MARAVALTEASVTVTETREAKQPQRVCLEEIKHMRQEKSNRINTKGCRKGR